MNPAPPVTRSFIGGPRSPLRARRDASASSLNPPDGSASSQGGPQRLFVPRAPAASDRPPGHLCEAVARALERELTGALNVAEPAPLTLAAFLSAKVARLGVRCVFLPP